MPSNALKAGVATFIIGLVLYIVGFATQYWIKGKKNGVEEHNGLFRGCGRTYSPVESPWVCQDAEDVPDWWTASQVLCSIGLALVVFGGVLSVFGGLKDKLIVAKCGAVLLAVAGIVGIVGGAVFVGKSKDKSDALDVGWSAIVFFIGCLFLLITALLQLLASRSSAGGENTSLLRG